MVRHYLGDVFLKPEADVARVVDELGDVLDRPLVLGDDDDLLGPLLLVRLGELLHRLAVPGLDVLLLAIHEHHAAVGVGHVDAEGQSPVARAHGLAVEEVDRAVLELEAQVHVAGGVRSVRLSQCAQK